MRLEQQNTAGKKSKQPRGKIDLEPCVGGDTGCCKQSVGLMLELLNTFRKGSK